MGAKSIRTSKVQLQVPFYDVDPMQVVWHGNCLNYFEVARAALFDQAGVDLYDYAHKTGFLFPIIKTTTKHTHPLRFRDQIECTAELVEARRKIVVDFEIRLISKGTLCAKGRSEQVAIRSSDYKLELTIPEEIQRALNRAQ